MIVVDTSAVLDALVASPRHEELAKRLAGEDDLHAPHLIDVEFLHVVRRLVIVGELSVERAADARLDFADLTMMRYPHHPLADRMWQLRHNLTAYDAAFIALSEALDAPLVTTDARLAAGPGHNARIELYGAAPDG